MAVRRPLAGVVLLVLLQGSAWAAQDPSLPGRRLFQEHCAACHGPNGEGGRGPRLAVPTLPRAQSDDELTDIIQNGIWGTTMPISTLSWEETLQVAEWVRALGRSPAVAVPGRPEIGDSLYRQAGCATCHTVRGRGGAIGPDLTDIGLRRGPGYLKRALTTPGADVPTGASPYRTDISLPTNFLQVHLVKDGQSITGVRVNEDTFSIQIRDLSGRLRSFLKSELSSLRKAPGQSPMPAYGDRFTDAQLDDLVAYLASLRGEE